MNKCVEDVLYGRAPRELVRLRRYYGWYYPGQTPEQEAPLHSRVDRRIWDRLEGHEPHDQWNGKVYATPHQAVTALYEAAERFYLDRS